MPFLNDLLEENKAKFAEVDSKVAELNAMITTYENKLRVLKEELNAVLNSQPSFKKIVQAICDHLVQYFPDGTKIESIGPYSLRSVYAISIEIPNLNDRIMISLVPIDIKQGIIGYDTGKQFSKYAANSLGAINGFNNEVAPITDIMDIVKVLKEEISKTRTYAN